MTAEDIFIELRKLNRMDKLRAMEVLVLELAAEEQAQLIPNKEYEVWSPYNSQGAAEVLMEMLDDERKASNANS